MKLQILKFVKLWISQTIGLSRNSACVHLQCGTHYHQSYVTQTFHYTYSPKDLNLIYLHNLSWSDERLWEYAFNWRHRNVHFYFILKTFTRLLTHAPPPIPPPLKNFQKVFNNVVYNYLGLSSHKSCCQNICLHRATFINPTQKLLTIFQILNSTFWTTKIKRQNQQLRKSNDWFKKINHASIGL